MSRPMRFSAAVFVTIVLATFALTVVPTSASARVLRTASGAMLSCPDPSVVDARAGGYRYYLICTSDHAADAFPIRGSDDLVHWRFVSYVFPAGTQPHWAIDSPAGRFWAPALYRIGSRWIVYFAAQHALSDDLPVAGGQTSKWVIGVATTTSIRGPWHSEILHYRGQFNGRGGQTEAYGGVIDPSMVQDPSTGQRYLFYAEQSTSIWVGQLSSDGLRLEPDVHEALWARPGWEQVGPGGNSCVEGPTAYYRDGWFYLFYSGASTWSGSYAVGAAVSTDPMHGEFQNISSDPILRSGDGWLGPGGQAAPVTAPDGRTYLFYHALKATDPTHESDLRYLMVSPVTWTGLGGYYPLVGNNGMPS